MIARFQDWLLRQRVRRRTLKCLRQIPYGLGGGCPDGKALLMAELICRFQLKTTVDVGVYYGRSFFPQVIAHHYCTGGMAFGVDPYNCEAARQSDNVALKAQLDAFAETTDFEAVFKSVVDRIATWSLAGNASLLRCTSVEAAKDFRNRNIAFDLIHIDGNHDAQNVLADVDAWLPLLSSDGFFMIDDTNWDSVRPALAKATEQLRVIFEPGPYAVLCPKQSPRAEPATAFLKGFKEAAM